MRACALSKESTIFYVGACFKERSILSYLRSRTNPTCRVTLSFASAGSSMFGRAPSFRYMASCQVFAHSVCNYMGVEIDALHENGDLVIGNNDVVLLRTSFKNISDCGITSASVYDSDTEDLLTWCNVTASAKNKCSVSCLMSVADYIQNKMKVYIGALEMSEKYKTRNWTVSCSTLKGNYQPVFIDIN